MARIRLDRLLASQGLCTRKEAKRFLHEGCVMINGVPAREPGRKVDPVTETVVFRGKTIAFYEKAYYMMNKPKGVLSASRDAGQKTILDLLPVEFRRPGLFPAGRLDKDTEGLLIITDDGDFAHEILAPGKHVDKTYFVQVNGSLTEADVEAFRKGIRLEKDDAPCLPARLEILGEKSARVVIQEGRYHQIKKMFEARGKRVEYLKRTAMGRLPLDEGLAPGSVRRLTAFELQLILFSRSNAP